MKLTTVRLHPRRRLVFLPTVVSMVTFVLIIFHMKAVCVRGFDSEGPTSQPSFQPSSSPTTEVAAQLSSHPSLQPSTELIRPTDQPSDQPTNQPTVQPSGKPSSQPSRQPFSLPTSQPSYQMSAQPSAQPTCYPTSEPSGQPTDHPTVQPTAQPTSVPSIQPSAKPSISPSTQPSSRPSSQPSCCPTMQPSTQPTVRPTSSAPSSMPSLAPSKFPTTSAPTQNGDTNPPSNYPSAAPTYDLDYSAHFSYTDHANSITRYAAVADSYTYSSYFFKGLTVEGTCEEWNSFTENELLLPFDDVEFRSVTLDSDITHFGEKTFENVTAECTSSVRVEEIIEALRGGSTAAIDCDGNQWRVFPCNGNSVVCVNCKENCVVTESCPGTAFIVNPCTSCTTHAAASSILNVRYTTKILYPEFRSAPVVSASRTSLTVAVNVSAAGIVYCAAVSTGTVLNTVLTIRSLGQSLLMPSTGNGTYDMQLSGLRPDTEYDVYCYTEDFESHVMPLAESVAVVVTASTLCCRSIAIIKSHSHIVQYIAGNTRPELLFEFQLDSKPTGFVEVTTSLQQIDCTDTSFVLSSTVSTASVLPSAFEFLPNSTSLQGAFLIRGSVTGCYRVLLEAHGSDSYTPANTTFSLLNVRIAPSVPALSDIRLSNSGSFVLLNFDSATDRGAGVLGTHATTFNCSLLVLFPGSNEATCKWINSTQISAELSSQLVQPTVGDNATLLGNTLLAECVANTDCSLYTFMASETQTILSPYHALAPTPILSSPTSIAACDDIFIDPTLSKGFGGRDWKSVVWSVTGNGIAEGANAIAAHLNAQYQDTFTIVQIPNSLLTRSRSAGATSAYTISVTLTNFLSQSGIAAVTITVNSDADDVIPNVLLSGVSEAMYRWQPLSVFASVTWPSCASNETKLLPVAYNWKLYEGVTYLSSMQSASRDRRYFKLSPYSLDAATTYSISVTASVTSGNEVISSVVTGTIQVGQSGVSATISGAGDRVASALDTVLLDASESEDIDYPASGVLTYDWSCAVYSPVFGDPCDGFVSNNSAVLKILPSSLAAQVYAIGVTVTNSLGAFDSSEMRLTLKQSQIPSVSIQTPLAKYNAGDKVILTSTIGTSAGVATAVWSSASSSIADLGESGFALTPLRREIPQKESSFFQLSIASNSLTAGLTYAFSLTVAYDGNLNNPSISTVTVRMNEPPTSGVLSVVPSTGQALSTQYTFTTSRWTDDAEDLPLAYILAYYKLKISNLNVIKPIDGVSYVTSTLGQGLRELDYIVTGIAFASDIYGSESSATAAVTATLAGTPTAVAAASSASIDSALQVENPTEVTQAVDAALSSVNSADCRNVPVECASINRELCSDTPDTCGPCLSGYVGPVGDSNVACNSSSAVKQVGDDCSNGEDCITGKCGGSGLCADIPKSCPGNCTNRGVCRSKDIFSGEIVSSCLSLDATCRAECDCDDNRFGASCSLGPGDYNKILGLRDKLCFGIYQTLTLQDVTSDVIKSRALSISNLLLDVNQISDMALLNCSAALISTVVEYPGLSCQDDTTFNLVSGALSNILEKGSALPEGLLANLTNALSALSNGCQDNIAVGEAALSVTNTNLRLSVEVVDSEDVGNTSFIAPQSEFESFNGQSTTVVTLGNSSGSGDSVAVSIYQYNNNPRGEMTNSSSVGLQTVTYNSTTPSTGDENTRRRLAIDGESSLTPRRRRLNSAESGVTLVLHNYEPIDYGELLPSYHELRCFGYQATNYTVNITCPIGMMIERTCPAFAKGVYNVTCPGYSVKPQCTTYTGESFEVDDDCSVVSYTAMNTTCFCEASAGARRTLQSGASTTVTEYATTFVVLGTEFGATFTTAPPLTDAENDLVILSILVGVLIVFALGFIAFCVFDFLASHHQDEASKITGPELRDGTGSSGLRYRTVTEFFESLFPMELRSGPWYMKLYQNMLKEHPWICLFAPYDNTARSLTMKWVIAMSQLIIFMFVNCIIALLVYADDGYCEDISDETECVDATTSGGYYSACSWRTDNESCEYQEPELNFLNGVIISFIAAVFAVPLEQIVKFCVRHIVQHFHLIRVAANAVHPVNEAASATNLLARFDEFSLAQSVRSTMLRGARLEKARRAMDFSLPQEEAYHAYKTAQTIQVQWQNGRVFLGVVQEMVFRRYRNNVFGLPLPRITEQVHAVREHAQRLKVEMEQMLTTEEQEIFLMKNFIVNIFQGYRRRLVAKYFLSSTFGVDNLDRGKDTAVAGIAPSLGLGCLFFLILMLLVMIYYIYLFSLLIGSRATDLWLLSTWLNIGQAAFFLEPLKLYIRYVVVTSAVSDEVREVVERLIQQSKLVLMRTHGVMKGATSMIQHFNPACRVARMHPELAISRLLLTLNDNDVPLKKRVSIVWLPYTYFTAGIFSVSILPEILQDSVLRIFTVFAADAVLIGIFVAGQKSVIWMVLTIMGVLIAFIAHAWWVGGCKIPSYMKHGGMSARERSAAINLFTTIEDDTEDYPWDDREVGFTASQRNDGAGGGNSHSKAKKPSVQVASFGTGGTVHSAQYALRDLQHLSRSGTRLFQPERDIFVTSELINFDDYDAVMNHPRRADEILLLARQNRYLNVAALQRYRLHYRDESGESVVLKPHDHSISIRPPSSRAAGHLPPSHNTAIAAETYLEGKAANANDRADDGKQVEFSLAIDEANKHLLLERVPEEVGYDQDNTSVVHGGTVPSIPENGHEYEPVDEEHGPEESPLSTSQQQQQQSQDKTHQPHEQPQTPSVEVAGDPNQPQHEEDVAMCSPQNTSKNDNKQQTQKLAIPSMINTGSKSGKGHVRNSNLISSSIPVVVAGGGAQSQTPPSPSLYHHYQQQQYMDSMGAEFEDPARATARQSITSELSDAGYTRMTALKPIVGPPLKYSRDRVFGYAVPASAGPATAAKTKTQQKSHSAAAAIEDDEDDDDENAASNVATRRPTSRVHRRHNNNRAAAAAGRGEGLGPGGQSLVLQQNPRINTSMRLLQMQLGEGMGMGDATLGDQDAESSIVGDYRSMVEEDDDNNGYGIIMNNKAVNSITSAAGNNQSNNNNNSIYADPDNGVVDNRFYSADRHLKYGVNIEDDDDEEDEEEAEYDNAEKIGGNRSGQQHHHNLRAQSAGPIRGTGSNHRRSGNNSGIKGSGGTSGAGDMRERPYSSSSSRLVSRNHNNYFNTATRSQQQGMQEGVRDRRNRPFTAGALSGPGLGRGHGRGHGGGRYGMSDGAAGVTPTSAVVSSRQPGRIVFENEGMTNANVHISKHPMMHMG